MKPRPHIALACASNRGLLFARHLRELAPEAELTLFSFREEPWEPPFLADIEHFAAESGARLIETRHLHANAHADFWNETPPDLLFAVGWRYLLPACVFERPRLGSWIFHDSLLPRFRGFAPTVWAMINGEQQAGATLFRLSTEHHDVDSGPILDQSAVPIGPEDDISKVMQRVTQTYLDLLERNLSTLLNGTARPTEQDESLATYTCKRVPEDARIDWRRTAREIHNLIRASSRPYPGAFAELNGERITIWRAAPVEGRRYVGAVPGRVIERRHGQGVVVLTGDGALLLAEVQREGESPCSGDVIARRISDTFR